MRKWLIFFGVAAVIVVLDQFTKTLVANNMLVYEQWMPLEFIRPHFTITYVQNTGAAFGIFQNGNLFFIVVGFIVVGFVLFFFAQLPEHSSWTLYATLGLMLGGALGNLTDRLTRGFVVDMFDAKFWPVFNIADSAIVVGAILLVLLMWLEERRAEAANDPEPPDSSPPEEEPSAVLPG
ncbi:signal peptidase II [Chloroflexota bacterium]